MAQVKYSTKTSSVTIVLSWTEVRQFLNGSIVETLKQMVTRAIELTGAPKTK